jgi:hypothetical protein
MMCLECHCFESKATARDRATSDSPKSEDSSYFATQDTPTFYPELWLRMFQISDS